MTDIRPFPLRSFEDEALVRADFDKARDILRAALAEREKIRERARLEGFELGLADGRQAAAAAERELVRLSVRIAEKIVKAEVASGARVAVENLRRAVALAVRRREVRVRLNPADLEAVEKFLPELRREVVDLGRVELEADPAVSRGGAVVVTPEGAVDADLRTQLEEIERGLVG